jgi:DNA-binding response OmpR family regulator
MALHALIAMDRTSEQASGAPESECRVLVVDDDHDCAEFLCTLLTLQGHLVMTAYSGASAIALATEFEPHIVVLDIGMPKMNGYEVLRQMKTKETRARFIAMSALGGSKDHKLALSIGFDACLAKPVSVDELSREINLWLVRDKL